MHPRELRRAYERGENISALLRAQTPAGLPSEESIETAYDLQAGSYVDALANPELLEQKVRYGEKIAALLGELGPIGSLLEAGVGEGTTLASVLDAMTVRPRCVHAFDLAWSRVAYARSWLAACGWSDVFLSVARLGEIPYGADSFDVVFTSHALEPNRGSEEALLRELYRVSSRYLILLEPGYELACDAARARMDLHGYCRALPQKAERLGMKVLRHELFGDSANPLNPTALTIIEKHADAGPATPALVCPCFGDGLVEAHGAYYSAASLRAYPIFRGIPCLRTEKAVIAAKFLDEPDCGSVPAALARSRVCRAPVS